MFPGKLQVATDFCTIAVNAETTITDLIREALDRFGLDSSAHDEYRLCQILLDRGGKYHSLFHSFVESLKWREVTTCSRAMRYWWDAETWQLTPLFL